MSKQDSVFRSKVKWRIRIGVALASVLVLMLAASSASAFSVYKDDCWSVQWDTSVKYSLAFRTQTQDPVLIGPTALNADDGDRNFKPGLISNRLDVLSELDIAYKKFGFRFSAAGWGDEVYNADNSNRSPATFNGIGDNDKFPGETGDLAGRYIELLDAFFHGETTLGCWPLSFRVGRYTLMWGETLFFATNGIAYGQAPIDGLKLLSEPGTEAKELFMPVGQMSFSLQPASTFSVSAYADFEWRRTRGPASGSYFSDADPIDAGGQRLLLTPSPPGLAFWRTTDMGGGFNTGYGEFNLGQWGVSTHFRVPNCDVDWGLYYLHYNEKSPYWVYLQPGLFPGGIIHPGQVGSYFEVFPENIQMIGASFGTQLGAFNVSGEASGRLNDPLTANPATQITFGQFDNKSHVLYPVGDTVHANLSATYFLPPTCLWGGGVWLAEVAGQYLVDISKNEQNFGSVYGPRTEGVFGLRTVFQPNYYQVWPGWDITVPIGWGWTPVGASPVDLKFNGGAARGGGDWSLGVTFTYQTVWNFSAKYTYYYGTPSTQTLLDRNFVSVSAQRTF